VVGADPKGGKGRGVVSTANYEARKYGIHSALPISKAFKLCPKAIFLPVNIELYQKVSEKIMKIIKKYSPIFEQVSLDEAYLDLSSIFDDRQKLMTKKAWEVAEDLAKKLKKEIFEKEKLTSTIGIGPNKK
jgi:DNA polymerase IV (DinB-like DNA polymerase)